MAEHEHIVEIPSSIPGFNLAWRNCMNHVMEKRTMENKTVLQAVEHGLSAYDAVLKVVSNSKVLRYRAHLTNSDGYMAWCLTYA